MIRVLLALLALAAAAILLRRRSALTPEEAALVEEDIVGMPTTSDPSVTVYGGYIPAGTVLTEVAEQGYRCVCGQWTPWNLTHWYSYRSTTTFAPTSRN